MDNNEIKETVETVVEEVKEAVAPAVEEVKEVVAPVVEEVNETVDPVVEEVKSAAATAVETVAPVVEAVKPSEPVKENVTSSTAASKPGKSGFVLCLLSLIFGAVSFVVLAFCCCLPGCVKVLPSILSIVGLILGIISFKKPGVKKPMAIIGIILSSFAVVLVIVAIIMGILRFGFNVTGTMFNIQDSINDWFSSQTGIDYTDFNPFQDYEIHYY